MSERLTAFLKTVTDFANEECQELETKAQSYKDGEISRYRKDAENKSKSYTDHETGRILSRVNREISDYEAEKKTALTVLRASVTSKVFGKVKEKINKFTDSKEYEAFLINSAKKLHGAMGSEEITFFLRSADMKYGESIKNAVAGRKVSSDEEIILGGLRAVDKTASICGDDTLDARLLESQKKFAEQSDLKIY